MVLRHIISNEVLFQIACLVIGDSDVMIELLFGMFPLNNLILIVHTLLCVIDVGTAPWLQSILHENNRIVQLWDKQRNR